MDKIIKIASSQGSMGRNLGCEKAPDEILKYINENFDVENVFVDDSNIEKTNNAIFKAVKGFNGIIMGGDHSITYPAFLAMAAKNRNCGLIMMDAHVDCASYIKPPSHEDFLRVLIEDKAVNENNIIMIGVRKIYDVEERYLKKKKIRILSGKNILKYKEAFKLLCKLDAVYLSIDIDVFDPKIAMGTAYKEKNGIRKNTALKIIESAKKMNNLKIVDIVEVNPLLDEKDKTLKLAASIVNAFGRKNK